MKLPISSRLLACAAFVEPGDAVADVGCDHGYLSIHLLKNNIASFCIASDIHPQPLLSASRNAEKYGVRDRMQLCVSDGVRNIPRTFNVMICAGMGGDTMIHILADAPWLMNSQYRLILQCQSKTQVLREYLSENGWFIRQETVLRDGRFLYPVMEVLWNPTQPRLSPGGTYLSPALLESHSPVLPDYYQYIKEGLRISLAYQPNDKKQQAWQELQKMEHLPEFQILKEQTP